MGVDTKAEDIRFILSPTTTFKLNASSFPIINFPFSKLSNFPSIILFLINVKF